MLLVDSRFAEISPTANRDREKISRWVHKTMSISSSYKSHLAKLRNFIGTRISIDEKERRDKTKDGQDQTVDASSKIP